jgi:molecular chaperone GrpE (heat shock protein)
VKRKTAQKVSSEMLAVSDRLTDILRVIRRDCPTPEFNRYREGFGYVLGNLLTRVLLLI